MSMQIALLRRVLRGANMHLWVHARGAPLPGPLGRTKVVGGRMMLEVVVEDRCSKAAAAFCGSHLPRSITGLETICLSRARAVQPVQVAVVILDDAPFCHRCVSTVLNGTPLPGRRSLAVTAGVRFQARSFTLKGFRLTTLFFAACMVFRHVSLNDLQKTGQRTVTQVRGSECL